VHPARLSLCMDWSPFSFPLCCSARPRAEDSPPPSSFRLYNMFSYACMDSQGRPAPSLSSFPFHFQKPRLWGVCMGLGWSFCLVGAGLRASSIKIVFSSCITNGIGFIRTRFFFSLLAHAFVFVCPLALLASIEMAVSYRSGF
jgi:hypothetical protein